MKKWLLMLVVVGLSLEAKTTEEYIKDYVTKGVANNPNIKLKNVNVLSSKGVAGYANWKGYILKIDVVYNGKEVTLNDIVFSDGVVVSNTLADLKTLKPFKEMVLPEVSEKHYNREHLIAGNFNAKNKIVVFSDPNCPFCKDIVPDIIDFVNKNSAKIALFYYDFPIATIHPNSEFIIKASMVAEAKGVKGVTARVYKADFTAVGVSAEESLKEFNKALKTNIKLAEIQTKEIEAAYKKELDIAAELMVSSTPTIFLNGKRDTTKEGYKDLAK